MLCSICNSAIIEDTDNITGEDAVFCEGDCKSWMQQRYISMSKIIVTIPIIASTTL